MRRLLALVAVLAFFLSPVQPVAVSQCTLDKATGIQTCVIF